MIREDITTTVCAPATAQGVSAIAVIRVSGPNSIEAVSNIFIPFKGHSLKETSGNRIRFGSIMRDNDVLDEVLISVFKAPHSFTGEDSVEIACHGSIYIQQEIILLLYKQGIKAAKPGEFTQRAFLNGKMDLAQAEAVADLIVAENEASHKIALQQMRGGFSSELSKMRSELLEIVSLMELELDFSEEDVEFADRDKLKTLLINIINHINILIDSFRLGNVLKNGIPVAIVGATNTGKSTLLNSLLGEERAIVSDIHGTTRDFIEDTLNIEGVTFRFVDTAGIRQTKEEIEIIGIERTFEKIKSASIVLLMLNADNQESFDDNLKHLSGKINNKEQHLVILVNKIDLVPLFDNHRLKMLCQKFDLSPADILKVSAKQKIGIPEIKKLLLKSQSVNKVDVNVTLISNIRHWQALTDASTALNRALIGLDEQIPTDLLSQDIREAMFHLGEITGEINTEEVLGNIFSKFCIGK